MPQALPLGEPIDMAYNLERVGKNRDFSNPMYDAVVQGGNGSGVMGKKNLYIILLTVKFTVKLELQDIYKKMHLELEIFVWFILNSPALIKTVL